MPKESFKQPIKKEKPPIKEMEKKLEKAEKMVEEVEEDLKIEEFIEKPVKELKKLWKENEEEMRKQRRKYETFSFSYSLPLPETPPSFLERVSNKFLKEFDWGKFREFDWKKIKGRKHLNTDLGLFLSAFLKKNIENYILSQKNKGIKEKNIKPIEVHLKVKEAPIVLDCLGYQNPKKLHLVIEGDCRGNTGEKMQGGEIVVEGGCRWNTGIKMQGGKIIVEGNCGSWTGYAMKGGELNIKGEVKSFHKSAFSSNNQGTIIWKRTKIWENGDWTKEGKEMKERGEIPVE